MIMDAIKPYLLRAFYSCITQSNCTPILIVDSHHPSCDSLQEYVTDGEIVFNISPSAIRDLLLSDEKVEFKASFFGVVSYISISIDSVLAIYAEETDEGIFFDQNIAREGDMSGLYINLEKNNKLSFMLQSSSKKASSNSKIKKKPNLRIIE